MARRGSSTNKRLRAKGSRTYFPIKIPINTLSGGVGRQAPSKRLPSEAQDLDNIFCTTERSIDKRNGFHPLEGSGLDLAIPDLDNPEDFWWYWFLVGRDQQYLIGLDFGAGAGEQLLYVYKIETDGNGDWEVIAQNIDPAFVDMLDTNNDWKAEYGYIRDYIVHGNGSAKDVLRAASVGSSILILNTEVKAGFTSDGTDNFMFELDGEKSTTVEDVKGRKIEYQTSITVDVEGTAEIWTSSTDYVYPDGTKLYLGQSVSAFSSLKFPPDANDLTAHNGNDDTYKTIAELYKNTGDGNGKGKIYYLSKTYLTSTPGWYRVINNDKTPYLEKIRTPDEMAVMDQRRMPVQIYLDTSDPADLKWSIRLVDWDHRTSGSVQSNPGPSFFRDLSDKAQQVKIKAISYYRDRLFLASEDTLVSSRLGDFDNFYLGDPSNITFRDPVDLKVSSNVYTPITFLQPFKDFLFLGTSGDTQYELMGSENQISPLTAEIAPTSFFPMSEDMSPLVMNNNLFFFAKNRLFIYFPTFEATGQQAFELSRHVPEYLPDNFWTSVVSTAHNMIFAVEDTGGPSNKLFCYRNQVSGDQILQNAFFTFTFPSGIKIHSLATIEDHLLAVVEQSNAVGDKLFQVIRMSLLPEEGNIPRLDNRRRTSPTDISYDSSTNETSFTVDFSLGNLDQFIVTTGELAGSILNVTVDVTNSTKDKTRLVASGNYINIGEGYVGTGYTATIILSDIFYRDMENNIIPGTLNLRYGIIRHHISGPYNVSVTRKGREAKIYPFIHETIGSVEGLLDDDFFESDGVFKFPLLGFSDDLLISIESTYPTPMNLTNIEITGKFKRVSHFLTS